ncbi:MAG TPA: hypothetical protein PLP25_09900, partial [Candidatus Limiplasma sp.]|nr:hypothetical protein [Candidatus Limiplasma sp.]
TAGVSFVVAMVNGLSADLVLFGGDYADNSAESINFFQTIPKVQARLGVYGIVGDADRTGNDPDDNLSQLVKAMTNAGVLPLVNSVAKVRVGQTNLYIAGVDDYYNGHPDVTSVAAQVNQSDFVIFLGHTPDLLPSAIKAVSADGDNHWFDLALFGHTHGGQITLFGMTLLPEYMPDVGTRYLSGWLEENRAEILISNGVGTGIFPARLFAPSQIHLITLRPKTV